MTDNVARESILQTLYKCRNTITALADEHGVSSQLHPDDMILQFLLRHPCFKTPDDALHYYFTDGRKSAQRIADLFESLTPRDRPLRFLEFASGYGCVTRHLLHLCPHWQIVSCDIHQQAVTFIEAMGGKSILSSTDPARLHLPQQDVIFCLSFFSHMPPTTWSRWLARLFDHVAEGGSLGFTTHGYASLKHLGNPTLNQDGFWFKPVSEQQDLATHDYGMTAVSPAFVCHQTHLLQPPGNIVALKEGYWWDHQDLFVVERRVESRSQAV